MNCAFKEFFLHITLLKMILWPYCTLTTRRLSSQQLAAEFSLKKLEKTPIMHLEAKGFNANVAKRKSFAPPPPPPSSAPGG